MNVKPGDIAFVIAGVPENLGRLVRVDREHGLVDYAGELMDEALAELGEVMRDLAAKNRQGWK